MGWNDEIKAEQRAASVQTAELQRRRIASCRRYADVIDKAAPEIAGACRNSGVKSEGIKWLIEPKQWVFEIGPGAHFTIRSTGKWYFSDPTAQRLHEKVDKYYYWENCETGNDEGIIEDLRRRLRKRQYLASQLYINNTGGWCIDHTDRRAGGGYFCGWFDVDVEARSCAFAPGRG